MKKVLWTLLLAMLLLSPMLAVLRIVPIVRSAEEDPLGTAPGSPERNETEQVIEWTDIPVTGTYDYYVPYRLSTLDLLAFGSYVRMAGQVDGTTVTIEGVGSLVLDACDMVEFDLPAGTHIMSSNRITVVVYDDYMDDWEMMYIPAVQDWGKDYYYAGLRAFAHPTYPWPAQGRHYLLITAAFDGTNVDIDYDCDGTPEESYGLNTGEVVASGVQSVWVGPGPDGYATEDDPRAGAHITSNNPISVHAWATHEHYFGSGYLVLPTEALGTNYYVPFVKSYQPSPSWDDADRMKIVGTCDGTTVNIDEDCDGIPELTQTIDACQVLVYPSVNMPNPFPSGTHVTSDKPIGVVYTSPGGMYYWDGGAAQIVPETSSLTDYWNTVSSSSKNYVGLNDYYVLVFAFQPGTTVNVDSNNDGIIDASYVIDPHEELKITTPTTCYHIFSDKPIFATQVWWYRAGGAMSILGYTPFRLEFENFFTDSDFNPIDSFDTVWTPKSMKKDEFKLASTNPGQFMWNIIIHNTWPVPITTLTISYTLDPDFILKGADPIQVHDGYGKTGTRIPATVTITSPTTGTITICNVPTCTTLYITLHLEYGPARDYFPFAEMDAWKDLHEPNDFTKEIAATYECDMTYTVTDTTSLPDPLIILAVEE